MNWKKTAIWLAAAALVAWGIYYSNIFNLVKKPVDCSVVNNFFVISVNIGTKFEPNEINAHICDHIKITASDDAGHQPRIGESSSSSNQGLKKGESFEIALNKAGEFDLVDALHPAVKAKVSVSDIVRQAGPSERP